MAENGNATKASMQVQDVKVHISAYKCMFVCKVAVLAAT